MTIREAETSVFKSKSQNGGTLVAHGGSLDGATGNIAESRLNSLLGNENYVKAKQVFLFKHLILVAFCVLVQTPKNHFPVGQLGICVSSKVAFSAQRDNLLEANHKDVCVRFLV